MKHLRLTALILSLAVCLGSLLLPTSVSADTQIVKKVLMDESFDDYEDGYEGSATGLAQLFVVDANSIGEGFVRVHEHDDGNLSLMSHVFTQVNLIEPLTGPYTFSVSVSEMQGAHQAGVFIRGQKSDIGAFYEGDNGDPERNTSCGMNGLWLYVYGSSLEVNVKCFDNSMPSKLRDNTVSLPLPEGSSAASGSFAVLRVEDSREGASVYVDDVPVCTFVYSEDTTKVTYMKAAGCSKKCLQTVTVKDADGNEVMTVENTLVCADLSVVGWATRVANMYVDNVFIEAEVEEEITEPGTEDRPEPDTAPVDPRSAEELDAAYPVVHKDRAYPWLSASSQTYTYDFSQTDVTFYSQDTNLATASLRTNMVFADGKLSCKPDKAFSFGSAVFAGDDYGFTPNDVTFRLDLTGGALSVGTRLERAAADPGRKGVWFRMTPEAVTVSSPLAGFSVKVPVTIPAGEALITIRDDIDNITLSRGDAVLCSVQYLNAHGDLVVRDGNGKALGYCAGTYVNSTGYFTLYAESMAGSIDDVTFTHTTVTDTTVLSGEHAPDYSSWVATDDRARTTPVTDTSTVREGKQVGIFYFLCMTGGNTSEQPLDITSLYLKMGVDGMTEYLSDPLLGGGFLWAEPYFGYYKNTDAFIYRRHAYMLEAAGVDFIFLDLTNGATYPEGYLTLFDTWKQIRAEGGMTPEIVFFGGSSSGAVMNHLMGTIFCDAGMEKYGDLLYKYQGKPLYLGKVETMSEAGQQYAAEHLTVRDCWAWQNADNTWSWMQEYRILKDGSVEYVNGGPGRDAQGNFEALALCVGHHPTTNKGRSYVNTVAPKVNADFGFSLDSGAGAGFAGAYEAIKILDPTIMLITGWNEWQAGLNHGGDRVYAGTALKNPFHMVDTFNTEYSRDAEPMRLRQGDTVGFGDNYYYQMVSIIRDFKGQDAVPTAEGQQTVDIRTASEWDKVGPAYLDNAGDAALRHNEGSSVNLTYVNNTGRNDFDAAKVSQDADYLYFTVSCVNDIVRDDSCAAYSTNWMNLFINLDGDASTGWEGFDFVIDRARDAHYVSIESLANGWDGKPVGQALYTVDGKVMTIRVSKAALGVSGDVSGFLFKWADNSTWTGNVMEFMDLGDTAPNDRFAYKYVGAAGATRDVAYVLDGEALRDECQPLPSQIVPDPVVDETDPAATEPVTDPAEEPSSEPESAPSTSAESTEDTSSSKISGGCKSMVASLPLSLILLALCCLGKKKDE